MTQALLYSIAPQHMLNILNGLKTIEVRKRDLPQWAKDKLARGKKVIGYGYCTKGKPYLYTINGTHIVDDNDKGSWGNVLNGRVVVKFEVSGSEIIHAHHLINQSTYWYTLGDNSDNTELIEKSCVDMGVMLKYLGLNDGYAHHLMTITPVHMELGEFYRDYDTLDTDSYGRYIGWYDIGINPLTKAPQNMQTVWVK